MCKGNELDEYLQANGGKDSYTRIAYIGDGGNDFCPLLRMRQGDIAYVRKGFELEERVDKEGPKCGLQVDVKLWEQAWQIDEWVHGMKQAEKIGTLDNIDNTIYDNPLPDAMHSRCRELIPLRGQPPM
jgi:hypothetical protein